MEQVCSGFFQNPHFTQQCRYMSPQEPYKLMTPVQLGHKITSTFITQQKLVNYLQVGMGNDKHTQNVYTSD